MDFSLPVWWYIIATSPIEELNSGNIDKFEMLSISCLEADIIEIQSGVVFDPSRL